MGLHRIVARGMVVLGLATGLLLIAGVVHAAEGVAEGEVKLFVSKEWSSVELERPVDFMVFAAWSPYVKVAGSPGILAHVPRLGAQGVTWLIDLDGQVKPVPSLYDGEKTARFAKVDSGYVRLTGSQRGGDFQIRQLSSGLEQIASSDFRALDLSKANAELIPYALYDFVVAQDQLFGFGPFKTRAGSSDFEDTGFFTFSLSGGRPDRGRLLRTETPVDSDYFLAGFSYIAAMGSEVYFISMSSVPELYRFDLNSDLHPEPLGFRPMGDQLLPQVASSRELVEALSLTERIRGFPFDLFVHAGNLYCLTRSPVSGFDSELPQWEWRLTKLDISSEGAVVVKNTEILPSRSRFLRALPSPEKLFILEGADPAGEEGRIMIERLVYRPLS